MVRWQRRSGCTRDCCALAARLPSCSGVKPWLLLVVTACGASSPPLPTLPAGAPVVMDVCAAARDAEVEVVHLGPDARVASVTVRGAPEPGALATKAGAAFEAGRCATICGRCGGATPRRESP